MSTRAGCECVAHALQALCELDLVATNTYRWHRSFRQKSHARRSQPCDERWPGALFHSHVLRQTVNLCGQMSSGRQRRRVGRRHDVAAALFGQHGALQTVHARLRDIERLFACLYDAFVVSGPDRVGDVYTAPREDLWAHERICVHTGRTQVSQRTVDRVHDVLVPQMVGESVDVPKTYGVEP